MAYPKVVVNVLICSSAFVSSWCLRSGSDPEGNMIGLRATDVHARSFSFVLPVVTMQQS